MIMIRKIIFATFSLIYFFIICIRNFLYDRKLLLVQKLPGKVISIGNIEVGGTGKTPTVLALAELLKSNGEKVAILTRGYKSGMNADQFSVLIGDKVVLGESNHHADEGRMLAALLKDVPVIVGAKRFSAAQAWLNHAEAPAVWILDDGFQHRKIRRDFDFVLTRPKKPNLFDLLPGGNFRELSSSLQRATCVIDVSEMKYEEPKLVCMQKKSDAKKFFVICGIARPDRFFETCHKLQLPCEGFISVGDHQPIFSSQFENLDAETAILTTEKDFFRHPGMWRNLVQSVYILTHRVKLGREISGFDFK